MKGYKSFNKSAKILISLLFFSKITDVTNAKVSEYNDSDYEFNEAKKDYVYDPKTREWIHVEDLDDIKKKDKKKNDDGDKVIHKASWAFNEEEKKWERVDIKNRVYEELDDDEERTFGQNFTMGISAGFGVAFLKNTLTNLGLAYLNDKLLLFNEENNVKEYYKVKWMYSSYFLKKNITALELGPEGVDVKNANGESFSGRGYYIPLNFFMDYTAFQVIRFGVTLGIEALLIETLSPSEKLKEGGIKDTKKVEIAMWNFKVLFNFGVIFFQTQVSDFLVITRIGAVIDKGLGILKEDKSKKNIFKSPIVRLGLNVQAGLAWEYHVSGYITTILQFMYDFKMYNDELESWKKTQSSVKIRSHGVHLEVGVRFNFAETFID